MDTCNVSGWHEFYVDGCATHLQRFTCSSNMSAITTERALPVLVHQSVAAFPFYDKLCQNYNVRQSSTLVPGTILFTRFHVAFNIADLRTWFAGHTDKSRLSVIATNERLRNAITDQVKLFIRRHGQPAFVIFYCPVFSDCEMRAISQIQRLGSCRFACLFATSSEEIKTQMDIQYEIFQVQAAVRKQIDAKISKCVTNDVPDSFRYDAKIDGRWSQKSTLTRMEENELASIAAECNFA